MGKSQRTFFDPKFNRSIRLKGRAERLSGHAGALLLRELVDAERDLGGLNVAFPVGLHSSRRPKEHYGGEQVRTPPQPTMRSEPARPAPSTLVPTAVPGPRAQDASPRDPRKAAGHGLVSYRSQFPVGRPGLGYRGSPAGPGQPRPPGPVRGAARVGWGGSGTPVTPSCGKGGDVSRGAGPSRLDRAPTLCRSSCPLNSPW